MNFSKNSSLQVLSIRFLTTISLVNFSLKSSLQVWSIRFLTTITLITCSFSSKSSLQVLPIRFLAIITRLAILPMLWVAWCDVVDNGLILKKTCLQRSRVIQVLSSFSSTLHLQAPVVQRLDNAIHRIKITIQRIAWFVLSTLIRWIVIYPVDSVIQPLNNRGQLVN